MKRNSSRESPQTNKANNRYTSLAKTTGRVARFFPSGDRGNWDFGKSILRSDLPWFLSEMETLRGEKFTDKRLSAFLSSENETIRKYAPENWSELSKPKQAESRLAWKILELIQGGETLSRRDIDILWAGMSANLRGVKRAYRARNKI